MEWPSTLVDSDALIVREDTTDGPRYVVHGRHGPIACVWTYAEAEVQAFAHTEQACAHVWYAAARGLQLVGRGGRQVPFHDHIAG